MTRSSLLIHGVRTGFLAGVLAGVADAWTTSHAFFDRTFPVVSIAAWLVVTIPAGLLGGLLAAVLAADRSDGSRGNRAAATTTGSHDGGATIDSSPASAPAARRLRAPATLAAAITAAALVGPGWLMLVVHANVRWLAEDAGRDALLVDVASALGALVVAAALAAGLAAAFRRGGFLRALFATWRGVGLLAAAVLLLGFAFWRGGVGAVGPPTAVATSSAPDVIIVLIDTLRRDHLSGEGYALDTSPRLDELGRRGVRFPRFVSQSCYTKPSVASLFTSLLPSGHRVGHLTTVLAESQTTIAERFHDAGWRTGIFCANTIMGPEFGFAQGAEVFRTLPTELVPRTKLGYALFRLGEGGRHFAPVAALSATLSKTERALLGRSGAETLSLPAGEIVRMFRAWRESLGDDPCFAYLHVMEPHAPYEPEPQDALRFTPAGEPLYANPPAAIAGFPPFAKADSLPPDRVQGLLRAYDAEIYGVDHALGVLFDELANARPAILLVTSDHGEEFYEHGSWRHGQSLHGEMLDVPLILAGPGVPEGLRVDAPAQLIDLGPTLMELCGLAPPADLPGRSLVPWIRAAAGGVGVAEDREHVAEIVYGDAYWSRSLARGRLKLIVSRLGAREAVQLFDLGADPGETHDLAAKEPAIVEALRTRLDEIVAAAAAGAPAGETAAFDPVTRERLRALGYVE